MSDAPIEMSDIAVATDLLIELETDHRWLTNAVARQRQRIAELREVLDEWRTRRV